MIKKLLDNSNLKYNIPSNYKILLFNIFNLLNHYLIKSFNLTQFIQDNYLLNDSIYSDISLDLSYKDPILELSTIIQSIDINKYNNTSIDDFKFDRNYINKILQSDFFKLLDDNILDFFENKYNDYLIDPSDESINNYNLSLIICSCYIVSNVINQFYINLIKEYYTKTFIVSDINIFEIQLNTYIKDILKNKLFNYIMAHYNIKLKKDSTMPIIDSINSLLSDILNKLIESNIINKDNEIYKIILQFINPYMIELINKSLDYVQIIFDIHHKWYINTYQYIKTFTNLLI
jgi:hypothetical protein